MTHLLQRFIFTFALSFAFGCGTWVGNAVDQSGGGGKKDPSGSASPAVEVEINTKSSTPNNGGSGGTTSLTAAHTGKAGESAGHVALTDVIFAIKKVSFYLEGKEVGKTEFDNVKLINLGAGAAELGKIPTGTFDQVYFELGDTSEPLVIKGSFVNGATSVPVDIRFKDKMKVALPVTTSQVKTSEGKSVLNVTFDLDKWFNFKDRSFDLRDIQGTITSASAPGMNDILLKNIEGSSSGEDGGDDDEEEKKSEDDK